MGKAEEQARHYLLNEHSSPLTWIMHEADLKAEMQYHKDIENGYIEGYKQAEQDYIVYAQLWVDSGEVNIKSFKQFLKDRGYE